MRRFGAECAGTTALVVAVCCALASGSALAPAAIGAVTAILLALGPRAGGACNAAAAAAWWIRGDLTGRTLAGVLAAQLFGAVAAAVVVRALLGGAAAPLPGAPTLVGGVTDSWQPGPVVALVAVEAAGAFGLVYVLSKVRGGPAAWSQAAVVVGLLVMAMTVTAGQFGAGFFNPAVGIAAAAAGLVPPAVATAAVAAQLLGAVAAAAALGMTGRGAHVTVSTGAPTRSERVIGAVGRAPGLGAPALPRPRVPGDGVRDHATAHLVAVAPVPPSAT